MVSRTAGLSTLCPAGDSLLQQKPYDWQSQSYAPLAPCRSLPAPPRPLTAISSTAHQEAALSFESHLGLRQKRA